MGYPTRQQVRQLFWGFLDDPTGSVFVDYPSNAPTVSIFQPFFQVAYDAMYNAFLNYQCPRISEIVDGIIINPGTYEFDPWANGIDNFSQYTIIRERIAGSSQKFRDLYEVNVLPQRPPSELLREFVWRDTGFFFVGAANPIELWIEYESSGTAPTANDTQIKVDSCATFLARFAAAMAGPTKGRQELVSGLMELAVGGQYKDGKIGGDLFRLVQPLVRAEQNVQLVPQPFQAGRRRFGQGWWQAPFVAAQQGTTGGGSQNVPIQFSTAVGNIVGAVDGANTVFWVNQGGVIAMQVYNGGLIQTEGKDYTWVNNQITFVNPPTIGSIITAECSFSYQNNVIYNAGTYSGGGYSGS